MDFLDGLKRRQATFLLGGFVYLMISVGTYHLPEAVRANLESFISAETLDEDQLDFAGEDRHLEQQANQSYYLPGPKLQEKNTLKKSSLSEHITPDSPLIVLNLPHNGEVAIDRYFKCSGLDSTELGRYWTPKNRDRNQMTKWESLGKCMYDNAGKDNSSPLKGCGDFRVWTQLDFIYKGRAKDKPNRPCFFPSLQPDTIRRLVKSHPNASFLQVTRDPDQWAESLSMDEKARWPQWCNKNHEGKFPEATASTSEWAQFYIQTRHNLRKTLQEHPSVKYLEIDMDASAEETARMLHNELGIEESCWKESATRPDRPQEVNLPVFVAALPKSGTSTTHDFMNCGLGLHEGAHQWTRYEDSRELVRVGKCIEDNIQQNRSIFSNCGDNKHWSDTGNLGANCFYPTMQGTYVFCYVHHGNASQASFPSLMVSIPFCCRYRRPGSHVRELSLRYHYECNSRRTILVSFGQTLARTLGSLVCVV
jgi:hypothetical protein